MLSWFSCGSFNFDSFLSPVLILVYELLAWSKNVMTRSLRMHMVAVRKSNFSVNTV